MSAHSLDYRIDPEIFALCPGYRRGLLLGRGLRNAASPPELLAELRAAEGAVREAIRGNPAEYPGIAAWRDAFRRFGARPSDYRASIEALARRVLRGDELPSINALVDIGNLLSLRYRMPVGVHPVPAGPEPLSLRLAAEGDRFLPPDGGPEEIPERGEVVFAQGAIVLTRRWTWRQAAGTLTLPESDAVFFNFDALQVIAEDALQAALGDGERLVQKYCGGRMQRALLTAQAPQHHFPAP